MVIFPSAPTWVIETYKPTQNKHKFITAFKSGVQILLPAIAFKTLIINFQAPENMQSLCLAGF